VRKGSFFFFRISFFWNSFERTFNIGLFSNKQMFSFETNFERMTDEFRKNVIRSNDLSGFDLVKKVVFFLFHLFTTTKKNFIWKNVCPDLLCAPCTKKLYGTMTVHFIQSSLRQFWYVMVSRHEQDGGSAGAWLTLFLMATISMKKVLIFYYN
jgi:hypothetical protein